MKKQKLYRTTITLTIVTPGKFKKHPTNMIQSPGPIPSLGDHSDADDIDGFVEDMKITGSEALTEKETQKLKGN
jgi:hypothetical protein